MQAAAQPGGEHQGEVRAGHWGQGAAHEDDGGVHTQVQSHSAVPDPRTVQTIVSHHPPVTLGLAPAMRQLLPPAHPMET